MKCTCPTSPPIEASCKVLIVGVKQKIEIDDFYKSILKWYAPAIPKIKLNHINLK